MTDQPRVIVQPDGDTYRVSCSDCSDLASTWAGPTAAAQRAELHRRWHALQLGEGS